MKLNINNTLRTICVAAAMMAASNVSAQGWPAQYGGVMLQGFYWDSYKDSKWTNLTSQADELAESFDIVWVPQSGYCNALTMQMGYGDIWWLDHKSAFGTEAELREMIKTFAAKGIKTMEDVVINHKNGNTGWVDFPNETVVGQNTGKTYSIQWGTNALPYICCTDECVKSGYAATGASDTGSDFDGGRDLDHTNATVQENIKVYLDFLRNELGYAGFRYDMTGGYAPQYTKIYNESAMPEFSVGEYWMSDGLSGLKKWIDGTGKTSAAFDFELKWIINNVFNNSGACSKLSSISTTTLIGSSDYKRYAVTFAENHDTGKESDKILNKYIEAANAYILAMPGTPCVFLKHWLSYKRQIKKMIAMRKMLGINNESSTVAYASGAKYCAISVTGTKGSVIAVIGPDAASYTRANTKELLSGDGYRYLVDTSFDTTTWDATVKHIDETTTDPATDAETTTVPEIATVQEGTYAYFEKPSSWNDAINVWAWNTAKSNANAYTGASWPGTVSQKDISVVGTNNGRTVYLWKYSGTATPNMIIFNDGSNQTADLTFQNGGYYTSEKCIGKATNGINAVIADDYNIYNKVYSISGQYVGTSADGLQPGIYIVNKKKVVVR